MLTPLPGALHVLQALRVELPEERHADELAALRVVEALLAAGYRPTVWRNVAPPAFLHRGSQVLEVFDPFDFHSPLLSPRQALLPGAHALLLLRGVY